MKILPNHPLHALLPKNTGENCNYELRDKTEDVLLYQDFRFCRTKKTESFLPLNIINILTTFSFILTCFDCIYRLAYNLDNKQLLDEVFVICRIINVEVRVISRAEGEADNSYRDIDNFAYHKNRVQ